MTLIELIILIIFVINFNKNSQVIHNYVLQKKLMKCRALVTVLLAKFTMACEMKLF